MKRSIICMPEKIYFATNCKLVLSIPYSNCHIWSNSVNINHLICLLKSHENMHIGRVMSPWRHFHHWKAMLQYIWRILQFLSGRLQFRSHSKIWYTRTITSSISDRISSALVSSSDKASRSASHNVSCSCPIEVSESGEIVKYCVTSPSHARSETFSGSVNRYMICKEDYGKYRKRGKNIFSKFTNTI